MYKQRLSLVFITTLSLSAMVLLTTLVEEGAAFPETTLFVDPSVSTVAVGETFKIGIIVDNVTDLYSFEFKLGYNTTILDAIEVWVMWPDSYIINETAGIVWITASLPYPYPFSGSGPLATITFTPTEPGSSVLDLHDTTLVDFYATPIAHDAVDGYAAVIAIHDVAIVNVTPSAAEIYAGQIINITVVARNEGTEPETFNVTAYYNLTAIGTQTIFNLSPSANETLIFSWDTEVVEPSLFPYTIKAEATIVPAEFDIADNTFIDGSVLVKFLGDVNGDGVVNILDVKLVKLAYSLIIVEPRADLNGDGVVNILDVKLVKLAFSGII